MNSTKLKQALRLDSIYMLAIALSVWLPVIFMYTKATANPFYITQTLLWGTAYMIISRMSSALLIVFLYEKDSNPDE